MSFNRGKSLLISLCILVFGYVLIFLLIPSIEKTRPPLPEGFEDQDLAIQGARLKGYKLGFDGLIADWYWMQSLQYLGNKIVENPDAKISIDNLNALNPRLLYPYLDNATTLDPQFMSVYEFGATVLPAIDKNQAIRLLEKGIAENPDSWQLYRNLGFIYWRMENYEKAAEIYAAGARLPDAPNYMLMMAANMKSQGGSRETARAIYTQMFAEAQDEQSKKSAELRLLQLDSLDEQDAIKIALKTFQNQNGRCTDSWREIIPLLKNIELPGKKDFHLDDKNNLIDPLGTPYLLKNQNGNCAVSLDEINSKIPAR